MSEKFVDLEKQEVKLTPEQVEQIRENPSGLTREGVLVKVYQWGDSNNRLVMLKYLLMLTKCKNLVKSFTDSEGRVLLAKCVKVSPNGIKKEKVWTERIGKKDELGNPIVAESIEALEEYAESRKTALTKLTNNG